MSVASDFDFDLPQELIAQHPVEPRDHSRLMVVAAVAALRAHRRQGGRIVAIGTTSARTLETAAVSGTFQAFAGETRLFIRPGHVFAASTPWSPTSTCPAPACWCWSVPWPAST